MLLKVADLIDRDREALALMDTLESRQADRAGARRDRRRRRHLALRRRAGARAVRRELRAISAADRLGFVLREPIGVVSIITPWNFPLLIVSQKLPFALAAGCTCVVKPSEMTSASTLHLGALLAEAGLPEGACNIVTGYGPEVGAPMTTDPDVDMVSFTGSTAVGRAAMAAAAATLKKVSMELGGKNPQVIFPDADMDAALDAATFGAYFNAGECCNAGSRLLLHADIAEEFVAALAERAGDGQGRRSRSIRRRGSARIISADHLGKIEGHVRAARERRRDRAHRRTHGSTRTACSWRRRSSTGVTPSMAIARDEVFGPVVVALTFETLEEAIELANSTAYGLSASVWSRDVDTAIGVGRGVRAGTVWVNTFMDGTPGTAVRRLSPVGHRPRTRPQRRQGLHRRKDAPRPHRSAHELVAPARSVTDADNREPRSGF